MQNTKRPVNCPIMEQTADGVNCGRCWFKLEGTVCPRHGDVEVECDVYADSGRCTLENDLRRRRGIALLGRREV